jgi:hypothetical protein
MDLRRALWTVIALALAAGLPAACGGGKASGDVLLFPIDSAPGADVEVASDLPAAPDAIGETPAGADVAHPSDPGASDPGSDVGGDPGGDPGAADPAQDDGPDDAAPDAPDVSPAATGLGKAGVLYIHTATTLYAWDGHLAAPQRVADFVWPSDGGGHQMTDIALDHQGHLFGITFDALYQCNATTAACTHLADNPADFNGLTFVPAGTVQATAETLIAISSDGGWYRVSATGGQATLTKLGSYGSAYTSAGDAYSLESLGTFAAVADSDGTNVLVQVDPTNGSIQKVLGAVAGQSVYGLAGIGTTIYAFDETGAVYSGDVSAGTFQQVIAANSGTPWWGAGVSTRDPGAPAVQ